MSEKTATGHELPVRRPQRADARRNYDALRGAAREAFARNGIGASLEDIAQAAGVGIGTLYRNFPTRQTLFDSVFAGEVDELCRSADEVAALPPWEAFTTWLRRFVDYIATKRAIHEALNQDSEMFRSCRAAIVVAGEPLFVRAQKAAAVRPDAGFDEAPHPSRPDRHRVGAAGRRTSCR
jgi:AcrR family transcriptional regulator